MGRITAIAAVGVGLGLGAVLAGCGASETNAATETARRAPVVTTHPAVLELVHALASAGLDATEATATYTATANGAAAHRNLERMAGVGTLSIVRIADAESPIVYVFASDGEDGASDEERAWTIRHCLDDSAWAVASTGDLLVAAGAPDSWPAILDACAQLGGRAIVTDFRGDRRHDPVTGALHGEADADEIAAHGLGDDEAFETQASATRLDESALMDLYLDLRSIRAALDLFAVQQGTGYPDLAAQQWLPLTDDNYLRRTPANPMSPAPVASRIVEVSSPGADGTDVDPATAGWVWNSADGALYAAGVDESHFE